MRTADGSRVDPLTISDSCSRYLLRCQVVDKADSPRVQAIFEAAFREYGMPGAIRTDNGPPFASRAIAGLSRLAVWWIKLGIVPQRIQAGHPEQNRRHERMHRTLKEATGLPPANRRAPPRAVEPSPLAHHQRPPPTKLRHPHPPAPPPPPPPPL